MDKAANIFRSEELKLIRGLSIAPWRVTTGILDLHDAIGGWRKGSLTTIYSSHPNSCELD